MKSARNIFRSTFESQNMACLKGVVPQLFSPLLPGMEDDWNFFRMTSARTWKSCRVGSLVMRWRRWVMIRRTLS